MSARSADSRPGRPSEILAESVAADAERSARATVRQAERSEPGSVVADSDSGTAALEERLERIYRSRKVFSLWLLPPLAFFIFLVAWSREGFILIAVGAAIYLYMLAQFFIFQNPARRAKKAALRGGSPPDVTA